MDVDSLWSYNGGFFLKIVFQRENVTRDNNNSRRWTKSSWTTKLIPLEKKKSPSLTRVDEGRRKLKSGTFKRDRHESSREDSGVLAYDVGVGHSEDIHKLHISEH